MLKSKLISRALLVLIGFQASLVLAQAKKLPREVVPDSIRLELNQLFNEFRTELATDCAEGLCRPKGCELEDFRTIKEAETNGLPGLMRGGAGESKDLSYQSVLTKARCELAYEEGLSTKAFNALRLRLEQKLSRGFLNVSVTGIKLRPMPLDEAGDIKDPLDHGPWDAHMGKQLWDLVLKYGPWIVIGLLLWLITINIIWALRRLGKVSLDERLAEKEMFARLEKELSSPEISPAVEVDSEALARESLSRDYAGHPRAGDLIKYWLEQKNYSSLKSLLALDLEAFVLPSDPLSSAKVQSFISALPGLDAVEPSFEALKAELAKDLNHVKIKSSSNLALYDEANELLSAEGIAELSAGIPQAESLYLLSKLPSTKVLEIWPLMEAGRAKALMQGLSRKPRISPKAIEALERSLRNLIQHSTSWQYESPLDLSTVNVGIRIEAAAALRLGALVAPLGSERDSFVESLRAEDGTLGGYSFRSMPELKALESTQWQDLLLALEPKELLSFCALFTAENRAFILSALPQSLSLRITTDLKSFQWSGSYAYSLSCALDKIHGVSLS